MLRPIRHLLGLWGLAHRRLLHEPALASALLVGWLAAVALVSAIPMYTDAINQTLLQRELQMEQTDRRPAFAFLFHYTASGGTNTHWDNYLALDQYLRTSLASDLVSASRDFKLPIRTRMHYVKSDLFQLFPVVGDHYNLSDEPLSHVCLGFITDLEQHLSLVEGQMPTVLWTPDQPLEVLISQKLAIELGLQVGEEYVIFDPGSLSNTSQRSAFTALVRIAGIWQASDPNAPFWYVPPEAFDNTLLVPQGTYISLLGDQIPRPLFDLGWYHVFDGSSVRAEDVSAFLRRVAMVETRITMLLPGARLTLSPTSALLRYQRAVSAQSLLILLLGLPVVGLILIFITLTADSMVERQRLEISILKSRGSTSAQVTTTYILQSITLSVVALALGLPSGQMAAQAMGSTRQFLTFERTIPLSVVITRDSVRFAGLALLLALGATMIPALRAARLTIVVTKQAISRPRSSALWQQVIGDLLLFAVAGYGYYLLKGQGRIALLQWGQGTDPWENPLLFLAPTLFLLAGARLYLRALPPGLHLLGWMTAHMPGATALLAVRNLARNSHRYTTLITLLILTTGLGTFTASVARTLDDNLTARIYYQVGADVAVAEAVGQIGSGANFSLVQPALGQAPGAGTGAPGSGTALTQGATDEPTSWAILPVSEHQRVAGVIAAARVGLFKANVRVGDQMVTGRLYGVDRVDFPRVAYFRRDFAPASLGAFMNALAIEPSGILVRREFLTRAGFQIGDPLYLRGLIAGSSQPLLFKIVGVLDLFPTAYPGEGEFFIANLEYIFTELGGPVPYYVWLAVDETVNEATLVSRLAQVGFKVLELEDARGQIAAARARPERIGLFGFLSLGFIITTLLSMLALGMHAFLMYRQRFIQLGILRAIGFSARQVAVSLAGEQMLTTTLSILGGAALGLIVSHLFIPFMQIGHTEADLIPPFVVVIAQRDVLYAVMALITASLGITGGVIGLLSRLQVFQAIKLGEALG